MKQKPITILILIFACAAALCGCDKAVMNPRTQTPGVTQTPLPTPEPTPTPVPTETPFEALAPTTVMRFEELVGDNGDYSDPPPPPEAGTYRLVVNVCHQFITVYTSDENGEYTVPVRYMVCTSGSYRNPTPTGTFRMGSDRKRFSCFTKYRVYGQYWSQLTRNIYFHSILYSARNAKYYTNSSYRNLGTRASHGCIRLLVPDARWVYYNVAPGTEVQVIPGRYDDEEAKAIKKKLVRAPLPNTRPDLAPGGFAITEAWPGYAEEVSEAQEGSTLSE